MTASNIQITAGSGTRLATNAYTEGGVTVHDEKFIPGEFPYPTYTIYATAISGATAAAHILQVMAGSTNNVRIRRISATLVVTGAAAQRIEIVRLSSAGTGGTSLTGAKYDNGDGALGATGMTLPTSKGTESANLWTMVVATATAGTTAEWVQLANSKPIVIPAGTSNGIALKVSGVASTTWDVRVELVETSF